MSSITITPNIPSVTVPSAPAAGILLQPGQVITAQVVQVLGNDQVRISIGGQTIEAATQVPLQAGQTLQLQVSQTSDGIGLAIVNSPSTANAGQGTAGTTTASNAVVLSPTLAASLAANLTPNALTPSNPLSQLETLAVTIAAQTAATRQTSLAPLFANLAAAAELPNLPPQVQQAAVQVLAQQSNLDQNLTAQAVQQAFQSSGIFLEASLASGSPLASDGVPDLKAALIVLRQALTTTLSDVAVTTDAATSASVPLLPQGATSAAPSVAAAPAGASISETTSPSAIAAATEQPGAAGVIVAEEGTLPPSAVPVTILAEDLQGAISIAAPQVDLPVGLPAASVTTLNASSTIAPEILDLVAPGPTIASSVATTDPAARAVASSAALNLLQEVFQAAPLVAAASSLVLENSQLLSLLPVVAGVRLQATDEAEFARTNLPPPPLSGALPSAQPVAPVTLASHMPMQAVLQHLLTDTDGALARQTLLQVASLPGQADPAAGRSDAMPRWNFEIPFATPQGTAMAQFEISRDGGGSEANAAKQTWRARFSLDVEPAGPVHALISLNGERTSVRMWAERPATTALLRDGVSQLSQALSRAELVPGDITVRDGAPTQPAVTSAGHFLDRAL